MPTSDLDYSPQPVVSLNRSVRRTPSALTLVLSGELDIATADELRHVLIELVESPQAGTVVVDMSHVCFVDCTAIGAIVTAAAVAAERGRHLYVDGLHGGRDGGLLVPAGGALPIGERVGRADLWEANADERERLADERERLADERERLADERDALADRHERELDFRETRQSTYPPHDAGENSEQADAFANLHRAAAAL